MSLGVALSNALSGLNVSQSALATTSGNITNANTDGYSRKTTQNVTVVVEGLGVGANPEIRRIVDEFLTKAQRNQATSTGKAQVIKEYMDRVQVYLGSTDASTGTTVMSALDNFFSAVSNVSASPDQAYFRAQAVQSAVTLSKSIANLADSLQQTRFEADKDIASAVSSVNHLLDKLFVINHALREARIAGQPQDELLDQRDTALKDLTQYMDVGVTFSNGEVSLFNQAGELLSPGTRYHLTYSQTGSVDTLQNDKQLGAMRVYALDDDGNTTDFYYDLATSGKSSAVTTKLQDGRLKGLLELRDSEIPKMLEQLDSLANGLRETVNALNNNGVGYPPTSSLTGTRQLRADQQVGFLGSARIAAVDATGRPVASPYINDQDGLFRPLKLNFEKIYGPTGIGKPTTTDILKEINQYYGPPGNRVNMGPLADVKLVAISDNTTGPFQFDLQFENPSANALSITIVSVNAVPSGIGVTATEGEITRSAPGATYSVAGAGPYSIPVEIQFTDPDTGTVYHDTITFDVPAAASGARGDRYSVASLAGIAVPPEQNGSIITPTTNQRIATARMVDIYGNPVTDPTQPAFLQIFGNNGARIAIDELDSRDAGVSNLQLAATNDAFSDYYQLNDFFERNNSSVLGSSASSLRVRQSIINNPSLMSVGKLSLSSQPTGVNEKPLYTYEVGISSNQAAEALVALRTTSISFSAAGTLPAFTNSLSSYISEIYAFAGGVSNAANHNLDQQKILEKSYADRSSSVSGVNLDEELANTILFQNAYSASARIITVVSTLFDVLLQVKS